LVYEDVRQLLLVIRWLFKIFCRKLKSCLN